MNIEDLISQYIDGDLSQEAEADLHHRLAVSPEARQLFREQIMLRGVARNREALYQPTQQMRAALFNRLQREEGMKAAAVPLSASAAAAPASPQAAPMAPMAAPVRQDRAARRRRRLIPLLLPFVLGVIATSIVTQLDTSYPGGEIATRDLPVTVESPSDVKPQDIENGAADAVKESSARKQTATENDAAANMNAESSTESLTAQSSPGSGGIAQSGSGGGARVMTESASASSNRPKSTSARSNSVASGSTAGGADGALVAQDGAASRQRRERFEEVEMGSRFNAPPPTVAPESRMSIAQDLSSSNESSLDASSSEENAETRLSSDIQMKRRDMAPQKSVAESRTAAPVTPQSTALQSAPIRESSRAQNASAPAMSERAMASDTSAPAISPDIAMGLDKEENNVERSGSNSAESVMVTPSAREAIAQTVAPKQSSSLAVVTNVQQNLLVSLDNRDFRPELAIKLGGEFGNGHQVYGLVGYSRFDEETSSRSTLKNNFADASNGLTPSREKSQEITTTGNSTTSERAELWGGIGYRYNLQISRQWKAGGGIWSGTSGQHVRVGAELPVAYQLTEQIRIELLPTLQYIKAIGETSRSTTQNTLDPMTLVSESEVQTTSLQELEEVRAGVGFGISIILR